ncbi:hypothetical protein PVA45_07260 (plasmid) [Entomospira entomophila]|uniref:Uncharacterized protein n=1 Tax=Entomospira entomophila TaxID=2719988 RepID=A0A968GA06_9SPIO|nr:hypothetical protein [Entomospira entomophilus]NIZ41343.1 hypothetical protein [Entomospira entomophilus]WDI36246.1 hypothetical protein PVA45_07260 [Entomospira entomophilus]
MSEKHIYTISLKLTQEEREAINSFFEHNQHLAKASFLKMLLTREIEKFHDPYQSYDR